ncbi:MAG: carboxypeptidase regulatory-like domain-containing protein [Thermoplasmatota archaeon]
MTLLVASVFLVAASAQDSDPTSAPNAVYRATKLWWDNATPDEFCNTAFNAGAGGCATAVKGGPVTFNSSWDFTATDIAVVGTTTTTFFLCEFGILNSSVISVNNAQDNAHAFSTGQKRSNVTFPNVKFGQVGRWFVNTTGCGGKGHNRANWGTVGEQRLNFSVNATANLKVSLSQSTFAFTRNQISFTATVTDLSTGNPAVGVKVDFGTGYPIQTTNANGEATFIGQPGQAGVFTVTATRDLNGDGHPEFKGTTTWTVAAAALGVSASTTVFSGFGGLSQVSPVHFNLTYPGATSNITNNPQGGTPQNWTINISYAGCWWAYQGTTGVGLQFQPSNASGSLGNETYCKAGITNGHSVVGAAVSTASHLWITHNGDVYWQDNDTGGWKAVPYTFTMHVNQEGTRGSAWEYQASITWTPSAPKAINLKLTDSSGNDISKLNVLKRIGDTGNPGTSDHSNGGLPPDQRSYLSPCTTDTFGNPTCDGTTSSVTTPDGAVTVRSPESGYILSLQVTGSSATRHPCAAAGAPEVFWDDFATGNVTIDGDLLMLKGSSGKHTLAPTIDSVSNNAPGGNTGVSCGNGTVIISHIYPTKAGGVVHIHVKWQNTTTTLDVPIGAGAVLTVDTPTLVVDHATAVTFTLGVGLLGDTEPAGEVDLFRVLDGGQTTKIDSSRTFISGNATAGAGSHGQYTFILNETHIGDYIAFGRVGQTYHNYTYTTFRVVPAHDLNVKILSAADTIGNLQGTLRINATLPSGDSCFARANTSSCSVDSAAGSSTGTFYVLSTVQARNFIANGSLPASVVFTQFAKAGCTPTVACTLWWNSSSTLAPAADTWSVYVRSSDGKHDNLKSLVTEVQHPVTLTFNASMVPDNPDVQKNTTVVIHAWDFKQKPINGTAIVNTTSSKGVALFYNPSSTSTNVTFGAGFWPHPSGTPATIKFVNGVATVKVTGKKAGAIWFDFDPQSSPGSFAAATCVSDPLQTCTSAASGAFNVVGPNVIVNPSRIPVGLTTPITFVVKSLNGTPLQGLIVRICGPPIGGGIPAAVGTTIAFGTTGCTGNATTDTNGTARLGVTPFATGNLTVILNSNVTGTNIVVFAGLTMSTDPANPVDGDNIVLNVVQTGAHAGEPNVKLTVKNATGGTVATLTSNTNGDATWPNAAKGNYTVTASKAGFEDSTISVIVGAKPVVAPPAAANFALSDPAADQTSVDVGTPVTFTVKVTNSGNADGTATVKLRVNGVTYDSKTDTVAKGSSDTIAFAFTPSATKAYALTAALPDGTETAAVTVTAKAPVTSTPVVTSTPPPTTTTKPTTTSTPPPTGVPGFEGVLALLAAFGAAAVIGTRRRK